MRHRAEAAGPTDYRHRRDGPFPIHKIFFRVDRCRHHGYLFVELTRIFGQVLISYDDVRSNPTDLFGFAGKFQIAEIAVRRTAVRNVNRVVKIKYDWNALTLKQPLDHRRPEQSSFSEDVTRVVP